jgi:hypothetical protein
MSTGARRWIRQELPDDRRQHPSLRPHEDEPFDDTLARECEAFLHGRYIEWTRSERLPVPAWAWFNELAHADRNTIEAHVRASDVSDQPRTLPDTALLLEQALLDRNDHEIRALQRDVLIPLELELTSRLLSPRAILDRVGQALE